VKAKNNQPSNFQLAIGLMAVCTLLEMSSFSKERLPHSVYHFLQRHLVLMAMQWVRGLYSLWSLASGRDVSSLHRPIAVFVHPVGTNSSSSTDAPRLSHNGSALGVIPARLATGLTCQDSLNPVFNLWNICFFSSPLSWTWNRKRTYPLDFSNVALKAANFA